MNTNAESLLVSPIHENSFLRVRGITEQAIAQGTLGIHKMKSILMAFFFAVSHITNAETPAVPTLTSPATLESLSATNAAPPFAAIHILDDPSGTEVKDVHGIDQTTVHDVELLSAAFNICEAARLRDPQGNAAKGIALSYDQVVEDSSKSEPLVLRLMPCPYQVPVKPVLKGSPKAMQAAKTAYERGVQDFDRKLKAYATAHSAEKDTFAAEMLRRQVELTEKYRAGSWKRSDVAGGILAAVKSMPEASGFRCIICNSDVEDLPVKGEPRKKPFTTAELPVDVVVIFVNQSRRPDTSSLFKGCPNSRHHCNTMADSMKLIATWMADPALARPLGTAQTPTAAK